MTSEKLSQRQEKEQGKQLRPARECRKGSEPLLLFQRQGNEWRQYTPTTINCKHGRHHHHAICSAAAVLVPWLRLATAQSRMHHVRTLNRTRRKMNDAPFQCPVCATPATQLPKGGVGQLKRVNTRQGARLLTRQAAPAFSCRQAALRVAAAAQGENARTKGGSVENGCNEYKSAGDQHAAVL